MMANSQNSPKIFFLIEMYAESADLNISKSIH